MSGSDADQGGDALTADQATPYIANFALVDEDKNGTISQSEFKSGCEKGWVQAAAGSERLNMPVESDNMQKGQTGAGQQSSGQQSSGQQSQ